MVFSLGNSSIASASSLAIAKSSAEVPIQRKKINGVGLPLKL